MRAPLSSSLVVGEELEILQRGAHTFIFLEFLSTLSSLVHVED